MGCMTMWSDRKPWWVKKAKDLQADKPHYKNWCVIRVHVGYAYISNTVGDHPIFSYRAVGKSNAPLYYDEHGKLKKSIEVDNLTKQEAYEVAKGLNFLDGE